MNYVVILLDLNTCEVQEALCRVFIFYFLFPYCLMLSILHLLFFNAFSLLVSIHTKISMRHICEGLTSLARQVLPTFLWLV